MRQRKEARKHSYLIIHLLTLAVIVTNQSALLSRPFHRRVDQSTLQIVVNHRRVQVQVVLPQHAIARLLAVQVLCHAGLYFMPFFEKPACSWCGKICRGRGGGQRIERESERARGRSKRPPPLPPPRAFESIRHPIIIL